MTSFQAHIAALSWRFLPLSKGQSAIVDAADFEVLSNQSWYAAWNKPTQSYYAIRGSSRQEGNGKQITVRMHRQLLGLEKGDTRRGDHVNCDTLDYRRENLRCASHAENQRNKPLQRNSTTGYKGVTQRKGYQRWRAQIVHDGKNLMLGEFRNPLAAHEAYCKAAKHLFGDFARER
jgi:hypothetical protein